MSEYNLKPCPFCGGKAEFKLTESIFGGIPSIYIKCHDCECRTEPIPQSIDYTAREKAVKIWNRRVKDEL